MAIPLRIEYPGAFHHVINRGNAGEDIFSRNLTWQSGKTLGKYFGGISGAA